MPPTPRQATSEGLVGLRTATQTLKLEALRLGCVTPGARERNQESGTGYSPTRRSLGREAAGPGPDCSPAGAAVTAARSRAHCGPGSGTPVRADRAQPARPPDRRTLPPPPPPAARNAPLTRHPAARGRRAPRTRTAGRPPRWPADKARTAARTVRPEIGPRPRPGSFRCRSSRAETSRSLGGTDLRPAAGCREPGRELGGGRAGRHLPRPRSLERRLPAKCEWLTGVVSPGSCKCWR